MVFVAKLAKIFCITKRTTTSFHVRTTIAANGRNTIPRAAPTLPPCMQKEQDKSKVYHCISEYLLLFAFIFFYLPLFYFIRLYSLIVLFISVYWGIFFYLVISMGSLFYLSISTYIF